MKWDIKGEEHYIPKPGYEWYGTCWATTFRSWMEGTRPGWKWDANIGTRLYMRCKSRGLGRLRMILHLYIASGWRSDGSSDAHLETCMSLKCWLDGSQMQFCESGLDWAEMPFCGPGWRWVVTKMETQILGPKFSWDTTQMERRDKSRSLAGVEMQIIRLGWGWDVTWIELRQPSWDLNTL